MHLADAEADLALPSAGKFTASPGTQKVQWKMENTKKGSV
jgi:hypothetical protein